MERGKEKKKDVKKICQYCGQLLNDATFKCTRCHKWVDNKLFDLLAEDDVTIIKSGDLAIHTPSSISVGLIDFVASDTISILEKDKSTYTKYHLTDEERFNLLAFNTFCYFYAICSFARMKHGCRQTIIEMLRIAFLDIVTELFNKLFGHAPTLDMPGERMKDLYAKFKFGFHQIDREVNVDSRLKASKVFTSVVFADDEASLIRGLTLYDHFWLTQGRCDEFKKIFLVEERDFDWRAIVEMQKEVK